MPTLPRSHVYGRQRQLEHTWLLSLMGRYEDFWSVTQSALHPSCRQLRVELSAPQREALLTSYLSAPPFSEVTSALERLKRFPLAILSNGSPAMLDAAVRSSGLGSCETVAKAPPQENIFRFS
jgi:2-haloacid dehalogenase